MKNPIIWTFIINKLNPLLSKNAYSYNDVIVLHYPAGCHIKSSLFILGPFRGTFYNACLSYYIISYYTAFHKKAVLYNLLYIGPS